MARSDGGGTVNLADHLTDLAEGMMTPVQDTVQVLATKDSAGFLLRLRENGEPVNWPGHLEVLCDNRRPTFANLIRSGFSIEPVGE